MSKHTPGPWRYVRGNGSPTTGQHMIAGAKPGYLAEVRDCGSGSVEANARLIAAAPDLLTELQQAVIQMEMAAECIEAGRLDEALLHVSSLMRTKKDAIAKAKGGAA